MHDMRQPRPQLAARRKGCGFTQEELAYALSVDRSTIARWESGETDPQPWVRRKLARVLRLSVEEGAALLDGSSAAESAPRRTSRVAALMDTPDVRVLEAQVAGIAERYVSLPSTALLAEAARCHASLTMLLDQGGREAVRCELHQVATVSATLLSQLVWDASGRRDGSTTLAYCTEAAAHANECGDVVAAAHIQLRRTYVALYGASSTRDPAEGLATARAAEAQSTGVSQALSGLSRLHVAEAFAMQGEYRQCERALSAAESALDRSTNSDPAADVCSPGQFGRLAGSCYLALGAPERAEPLLLATAAELHGRHKTRSLVLGNLALSYLRQRQLEAATATLHEAVGLLEQSRGAGGMTVVFGAARELYPWRSEPMVQDVHDRLLGLIARN